MEKLQKEIEAFALRQREKKTSGKSSITMPEPLDWAEGKKMDQVVKVLESRTIIDIHSAMREKYTYVLIPPDPITASYITEVVDESGAISIKEITVHDLNEAWVDTGVGPPHPFFLGRDGLIYETRYVYRDPGSYVVRLPRVLRNVKAVNLLSCEVPWSFNLINKHNYEIRVFLWADGEPVENVRGAPWNDYLVAKIKIGNYKRGGVEQLLQEGVIAALNQVVVKWSTIGAGGASLFSATWDETSGKIEITASGLEFKLNFLHSDGINEVQCPWFMLGFPKNQMNGKATSWSNISKRTGLPYQKPMIRWGSCLYLTINDWHCIRVIGVDGRPRPEFQEGKGEAEVPRIERLDEPSFFSKIILEGEPDKFIINKFVTTPLILLDRQIDKITTLRVGWIDEWGNAIDFNGVDHSFSLEFVEMVGRIEGTGFSDRNGGFDFVSTVESFKISRN